jgi:hypothetical protein
VAGKASRTSRNETPVSPSRRVPASVTSTKQPRHALPVSGPEQGPGKFAKRAATAAVTGPAAWENGRDQVSTPGPVPPLHNASPADVHPCGTDCTRP